MNGHFRGEFSTQRAGDGWRLTPTSSSAPLELARQRLGWSYRDLGAKVGASHVAAFRWCRGLRPAPPAVYVALGLPAPMLTQPVEAAEGRPRLTVSLPPGCGEEEAREACVRAFAQVLGGNGELTR